MDGGGAGAGRAAVAVEGEGGARRPQGLNVTAETVAGEVAAGLAAERLVVRTGVAGVVDAAGAVRPRLSVDGVRDLLDNGTVTGGMIPKVEAALRAAAAGVPTTIADGRQTGALRALLAGRAADTAAAGICGTSIA